MEFWGIELERLEHSGTRGSFFPFVFGVHVDEVAGKDFVYSPLVGGAVPGLSTVVEEIPKVSIVFA